MNAIPPFAHLCEPAASLEDGHGRTVRYIRLSVTDRCNLRCTYCRSGMETFIPHESVLRYEEMEQLVDMAMDMGVEKVRLTGGEPFARKGFADFLERLRAAHPALDIRVTTNGTLIGPHIQTLKAIGLNAVNLSLDTFDRDKFEQITGRDLFGKVRENMDALLDAGIPFKLNAVAMRGFNDDELPAFIDYAMHHPIDVRFIEFMPMGEGTRWSDSCFWSAPDILDAVKGLVAVAPVEQEQRNGGPARLYTLSGPDGPGAPSSGCGSRLQPPALPEAVPGGGQGVDHHRGSPANRAAGKECPLGGKTAQRQGPQHSGRHHQHPDHKRPGGGPGQLRFQHLVRLQKEVLEVHRKGEEAQESPRFRKHACEPQQGEKTQHSIQYLLFHKWPP